MKTNPLLVRSKVGCPQGTLAGPMFWIVYVNSLKPKTPTNTVIYADDTTRYTPMCSENLQIQTSTKTHVSAKSQPGGSRL